MLFLLPFIDRGPERRPERRPIATISGILVIFAMGYLTYMGAVAGSPNSIDMAVSADLEKGKLVVAQSGCLACHKIGENGNDGPGPHLTDIGDKLEQGRDPAHAGQPDRSDALLPQPARGEEGGDRRLPRVAQGRGRRREPAGAAHGRRYRHTARRLGAGDVRPHRRCLRRHEHGHDGGAAPPLALARGRSRARRPGHAGAGRRHRHGRSRDRARFARRRRRRLGLLGGHARPRPHEGARADLGAGRRDGAPVPRRRLRRRHGRLRRAQLRRPRRRGCARWCASSSRAGGS